MPTRAASSALRIVSFICIFLACTLTANASGPYVSLLHNFSPTGGDGTFVNGGLVADKSGHLYGTTFRGGANGYGAIFQMSPPTAPGGSWTESILYSFASNPNGPDGNGPEGPLAIDAQGKLYGTTFEGGKDGSGTVFELAPNSDGTWTESLLYSFTGGADGGLPGQQGVVRDSSGNIYGVTGEDGTGACGLGCGVVFELTPSSTGWTETVIHSFQRDADGYNPISITLHNGNLYGTTASTASSSTIGTVFQLAPQNGSWNFSTIYAFQGGADGGNSFTPLVFDSAGNAYGSTVDGGGAGLGEVFELSPTTGQAWTKTSVYAFTTTADGVKPWGLILHNGTLYGTTLYGGGGVACPNTAGCGTIYSLTNSAGSWSKTLLRATRGPLSGPYSLLFQNGALFGTSNTKNEYGVIFKLYGF